ncbi:hypothetical protein ACFOYU_10005 [Microvirga sp. GCM10011540]|uniref:hypothetical protein n=1 Tax=Microvirga sp. GCM10011540 TaxID=3317338 RepID=UPI003605DA1D
MAMYRNSSGTYSYFSAPPEEVLTRAIQACPFAAGRCWEWGVNRDLIALFGSREHVAFDELVERYVDMLARRRGGSPEKPNEFNHRRAGNLIGWGLRLNLLEEATTCHGTRAWRLVDREMRWDIHRGRARQIRGLPNGEQAIMNRKLQTQRKRAATFAKKYAAKIAGDIRRYIDQILQEDPETVLDERFADFITPWFTPPQALHEAYGILVVAHHDWDKAKQELWQTLLAREYQRAKYRGIVRPRVPLPETMLDGDAAALDNLI